MSIGCGGGGGFQQQSLSMVIGNYTSQGQTTDAYDAAGSATYNPNGSTVGASSGSTSANPNSGLSQFSVSIPSVSSQSFNFATIDANYVQSGVNTLPASSSLPTGATINADMTNGNATATFTDVQGNVWNLTGTLDADGHNIDIHVTGTGGSADTQVDGNIVAPTIVAKLNSAPQALAKSSTMSVRPAIDLYKASLIAALAASGLGLAVALGAVVVAVEGTEFTLACSGVMVMGLTFAAAVLALMDELQKEKKQKGQKA